MTTALEDRDADGGRLYSPSAARNREAIRDAFVKTMPREGRFLELAAGTGEHAATLAEALPRADWRPGDPDAAARASIAAWRAHKGLSNLAPPHAIDAATKIWGVEDDAPFAGIVAINMAHISPFAATAGLFAGAARLLGPDGKLFLYGPFSRHGEHTAPSNAAFHESLKARNPDWGVRDVEHDLAPLAQKNALALVAHLSMPANNFSLVFGRA